MLAFKLFHSLQVLLFCCHFASWALLFSVLVCRHWSLNTLWQQIFVLFHKRKGYVSCFLWHVFHCATFHILQIFFLVFCLTCFTKTCFAELGSWEIIKAIGTFLLYVLWSSLLLIYAKWALCSKLYTSITVVFPYFIQISVDLNSYLDIFSLAFPKIGTLWVWKFNRIQIIFTCCASPKITAFWFHLDLLRNC